MRERGYSAEVCSSGVDFFMKVRSTAHTLYLSDGNTESAKCCVVVWGFFYSLKDDEEDKHVKDIFKPSHTSGHLCVRAISEPHRQRSEWI